MIANEVLCHIAYAIGLQENSMDGDIYYDFWSSSWILIPKKLFWQNLSDKICVFCIFVVFMSFIPIHVKIN